ncbi:Peptidyl-prolyl cis-trans isomerase CYP65 [Picochlorum sp. SENEW3]|nr:Peptidyl-prolyl cis-trans isomerase CYP65 [Picochlorum sp. SENEW3]WPT15733.1 Peptidyl-prolyl cis-trans isomerase CYP65 [Picochlorum sp. SENEW3]
MGRKSLKKDRAYITASEWKAEGGGHKGRLQGAKATFRRLPFNCCAISFKPVEDAVCTDDGTVMDIVNAVPYVQKFRKHPRTGEPLELKDLVRIKFQKNTDNEICCPVLGKVFNDNSHIVAIKVTGNVYSWEAVQELCLKPKNMRDLLTDEPFRRSDIIEIQDPSDLSAKNFSNFDHVKNNISVDEFTGGEQDARSDIKTVSKDIQRNLSALGRGEISADVKEKQTELSQVPKTVDTRLKSVPRHRGDVVTFKPGAATWDTTDDQRNIGTFNKNGGKVIPKPFSDRYVASHTSTGATSKSFTSTAVDVATTSERDMVLQQLRPKQKGYAQMHTSHGDINIELHCDIVPKACENFLALAQGHYYDGTKFHRLIPNFMIQGGDPTGTGKGGSSVFGDCFEDEFDSRLVHDARGQLSMANSGPNSNGSQFFILFKSARHLDFKHTVFGRVVGGFDVLTKMERIPTTDNDVPLDDIEILGFTVFVNPYTELLQQQKEKEERREERPRDLEERIESLDKVMGVKSSEPVANGVGIYLRAKTRDGPKSSSVKSSGPVSKKKRPRSATLGNFDSW